MELYIKPQKYMIKNSLRAANNLILTRPDAAA